MLMSPRIRKAIMERAESAVIRRISHEEGMTMMLEDGVRKIEEGLTSVEEVSRVV
jgi:type II secretory ATPase GspE/PulE/Tfp pilus assembly ATPase PilB-like protein